MSPFSAHTFGQLVAAYIEVSVICNITAAVQIATKRVIKHLDVMGQLYPN